MHAAMHRLDHNGGGFPLDRASALVAGTVDGAPSRPRQALISSVAAGCSLHLCIPN